MNRSEKLSIDQIKKIIPINGKVVNFSAEINISASTDEPFYMVVMSQTILEGKTHIDYTRIEKSVTFTVRNENNDLHPYVLVLKSDTPQEIIVTINLQELPETKQMKQLVENIESSDLWYKDWRYWVVIFLIIGAFAYFYWRSRNPEPVIVLSTKRPLSVQPNLF